jgi:hypothetical protein
MYELTKEKPNKKKSVNMTRKPVMTMISLDVMTVAMNMEIMKMKPA